MTAEASPLRSAATRSGGGELDEPAASEAGSGPDEGDEVGCLSTAR